MFGVICGAAIATGLLTWFVGVPQFTSERAAVNKAPVVFALPEIETSPPDAGIQTASDTPVPTAAAEPADVVEATTAEHEMPAGFNAVNDEAAIITSSPDTQWFAFWTPFRSEIAAKGFVGRLQSVTGLDYMVVRTKPGVYEVAFAYNDDREIDSSLATISAATGLELAGAQ